MMDMKRSFTAWVDGERPVPMNTRRRDPEERPSFHRPEPPSDRVKLLKFLRIYGLACVLICAVLLWALLQIAVAMPDFGSESNPTVNEVVDRYVGSAEHETGAENVIAGMILNYRGFDTFGESCVLFLAVCSVMQLMWNTTDKKEETDDTEPDMILSCVGKLVVPCVLCFGICTLFNGHVSPGGGFSGGSILGAALILFTVAYGSEATGRFFTKRVYNLVRISGLMIYACLFGLYIFLGANGIESNLAHYIVLVIDLAVGLVVMSTMYGFYAYYTKGDL